jgi:transposase
MSKEEKEKRYGRFYLESYKKTIVAEIESEGHAIKMVCERHGLSSGTVNKWIESYGSSIYFEQKKKRRSPVEKNKIVREIISGRSTISDVQLKYNLDCRETVLSWLRAYRKAEHEISDLPDSGAVTEEKLQLTEMQKELEMTRLKIRALEVMVDIASDQFKVDIRKKFGAKQ